MRKVLAGVFLLALSGLASAADDAAEARLSWQLNFGADGPSHSGYSLALGYREHRHFEREAPLLKMAELSVSNQVAIARLAGVPVRGVPGGVNQTEGIAYSSSPIYWVWWVVTGAVIAVVAIDQADSDDTPAPAGTGGG